MRGSQIVCSESGFLSKKLKEKKRGRSGGYSQTSREGEGEPEFTRKRVSLYTPLATRGPWRLYPYEEEQLPFCFKIFLSFSKHALSNFPPSTVIFLFFFSSSSVKRTVLKKECGHVPHRSEWDSLTRDPCAVISVRPLGSKLGQKRAGRSDNNVHTLISHTAAACAIRLWTNCLFLPFLRITHRHHYALFWIMILFGLTKLCIRLLYCLFYLCQIWNKDFLLGGRLTFAKSPRRLATTHIHLLFGRW